MSSTDTIFALATPPGKSGVAVVRLSGPQALDALVRLTGKAEWQSHRLQLASLRASDGSIIDRGLCVWFKSPQSFTGEDVAELQLHGSLAVIKRLLELLNEMEGLRLAEPGEFSRRAFANGKMDLLEAEGLADLIEAETDAQRTQAVRQMEGELSIYYGELRSRITHCLAHLEAYIDFPDEEIPDAVLTGLAAQIQDIQSLITTALEDQRRGEKLREGLSVVILGAPNAGKSSLLNALSRRDAAIVSHRAGTTRDIIEVEMDIAGYPVTLADTAGIRETADDIEEEGVRRALVKAEDADITLVLFDGGEWPRMDVASRALLDDRSLLLVSKSDLVEGREEKEALYFSTKTGEGIEPLLGAIERRIVESFSSATPPFITRKRHRALLSEAHAGLACALRDQPLELKCEELRRSALAIGKITGKIQVDDVLDVIFHQFCIGK